MNDSICNFIPPKSGDSAMRTVHFVYETEFHKMKQPFITALHYMHIVTGGEAVIRDGVQTHTLHFGSVFFFFPGVFFFPCKRSHASFPIPKNIFPFYLKSRCGSGSDSI